MDTTTATQIRDLLEELIPLLQEDVNRLQQESVQQEPLIQRLLQTEIQAREALIPRVQEVVELVSSAIDPDPRTVECYEHFRALLGSERYREVYESRNQTEKICEFGTDLMNLVKRRQWKLEHTFNKNYFVFKFNNRRVFGVHLHDSKALRVWLPENVLAECNNDQYTYDYWGWSGCGVYPGDVKVENITEVLEFAYLWHAGL